MKYIGIFLILLSSLLVTHEYSGYMKKRLSECEGFLDFIEHIRIKIGCFLCPVKELGRAFSSKPLSDSGFLDELVRSDSIYEAYKKCEPRLSLSSEEKEVLHTLFVNLGDGYLDDGVRVLNSAGEKMRELTSDLREKKAKNVKLVSALSVTSALGFFMLVI